MKISNINNNLFFKATYKKPIENGYETRKDDEIIKQVSYDFTSSRFRRVDFSNGKNVIDSKITHGNKITHYTTYNDMDKPVSIICKNSKQDVISETNHYYTPEGKLERTNHKSSAGEVQIDTLYDKDERKISTYINASGEITLTKFEYDSQGHLIRELTYDDKNKLIYSILTTYSEDDKILKVEHVNEDNEIELSEEYDASSGKIVRVYKMGDEGKKDAHIIEYFYDENSRLISEVEKEGNVDTFKKKYKYDNDGNLVKELKFVILDKYNECLINSVDYDSATKKIKEVRLYSENGALLGKIKNFYDENGIQIGKLLKNSKNEIVQASYFDFETDSLVEIKPPVARFC